VLELFCQPQDLLEPEAAMPARSPERLDAAGVGGTAEAFARDLEPDGRLLERELRSGAGLRACPTSGWRSTARRSAALSAPAGSVSATMPTSCSQPAAHRTPGSSPTWAASSSQ
jgi:hypothetical protein